MKIVAMLFIFIGITLCANSLGDKLKKDGPEKLKNSVIIKKQERSPQEQRVQTLVNPTAKPVDGINVKVAEVNLSKNTTVDVQYAPRLKKGELIDNKEQTTVNLNYKF